MKYWEDFLIEILPSVENCPNPLAINAVRNAAIEFCQRSVVWRKELDPITISATIKEYDLHAELENNETISAINTGHILDNGQICPLYVTTTEELDSVVPQWKGVTGQRSSAVFMKDTRTAQLYPIPETTIAGGLNLEMVLKPSRDATGVPDWLFEQWAEGIAAGAKARLFNMKSRPWYDASFAMDEQDTFDAAVKDASMRVNKAHSRRTAKVQMRPLA